MKTSKCETYEGWSNEATWAANFALTNEPGLHAKLWSALEAHGRAELESPATPNAFWTPFKTDAKGNITGLHSMLAFIRDHAKRTGCPEIAAFDGSLVNWDEIGLDWANRLPEIKEALRASQSYLILIDD